VTDSFAPSPVPCVFGFSIRSDIPLRFLRTGGGAESLEIVSVDNERTQPEGELLGEWPLQGTAYPAHAQLFRVGGGYEYWTSDAGLFRIDVEQQRIVVPRSEDGLLLEQRLHGMPMILSFVARGDISLHAAAVEIGAGAVILAAPSRFGKSTLAFALQRMGHRMLSEDLICCRPSTGEAIPGPAVFRIRPDVFDGQLPEGLFIVGERPDRILVGFDDATRGSGRPLPIRAIVFLREADRLEMEPVPRPTALKDLWRLSFRTGTEDARADSFRQLTQLAGSVPCWNLHRLLELDSLNAVGELLQDALDR
jgi:hypothetical protein